MTDYISREAALKDFEASNAENPRWTPQRVKTLLLRQPAADVAEVVRCKDCKYRDGTPGQPNILCAQMHEDDFCSYGECREGKDEK